MPCAIQTPRPPQLHGLGFQLRAMSTSNWQRLRNSQLKCMQWQALKTQCVPSALTDRQLVNALSGAASVRVLHLGDAPLLWGGWEDTQVRWAAQFHMELHIVPEPVIVSAILRCTCNVHVLHRYWYLSVLAVHGVEVPHLSHSCPQPSKTILRLCLVSVFYFLLSVRSHERSMAALVDAKFCTLGCHIT